MCNNCIHQPVCSKYTATGGHVRECDHVKEERSGRWEHTQESGYYQARCTACGQIAIKVDYDLFGSFALTWPYCPNCGADMKGETK